MAKKKYFDYERLNHEIEKIIDKGYMPPTRLYKFQEGRTRIVVSNELRGAGFIRSYEEALKFVKRKDKNADYSIDEYKAEIKSLQDALGTLRTERGVTIENRQRLLGILKEAGIDGKRYSTKKLYDAIKEAQRRVQEGNYKSPQFYEFLTDILES